MTTLALVPSPAVRPEVESDGVRYAIEADGLRYEYQAVFGTETLLVADDPEPGRNRAKERAADAERLRRRLAERLGVGSVEELREAHRETIESLRRLGYL